MQKRLILGGTTLVALVLSLTLSFFALAPHAAFAATVRNVKVNCGGQLPPVCYTTVHDAVNAAAAGDTVLVHPGTFTEANTLNITVPLRLQGFGPGVSILRGSLNPEAIAITLTTPGKLTIAGFALEGNNQPHPGSSDLIVIMDAQATNTIEIAHNAFFSNNDTDPNHATQFTEAIRNFNSTSARLTITHNSFTGFGNVSEFFNYVGPLTVSVNDIFNLNGVSVSGHISFDEFTCCSPLVIPNQHLYRDNTFEKYTGSGIVLDGNNAQFDDMRLLSNTFSLSGPNNTSAIGIGGFGTGGRVRLLARENKLNLSGGMNGIEINQAVSGLIERNTILGSVAPGSDGVAVSIGSLYPTALMIRSNRITTFDTGLAVTNAMPPGGAAVQTVAAHNNCIFGNASFGANNTTALTVNTQDNWWGAASGPFNAISNPGGTGNSVSNGITFIPFLAASSPTCP